MPEDVGINKPFDRIMKSFADEAPRLLLHVLNIASLDEAVEIGSVRPETAPPVSFPDLVMTLKLAHRPKFIFHCEFLLYFIARAIADVARYGGSLAQQHHESAANMAGRRQRQEIEASFTLRRVPVLVSGITVPIPRHIGSSPGPRLPRDNRDEKESPGGQLCPGGPAAFRARRR